MDFSVIPTFADKCKGLSKIQMLGTSVHLRDDETKNVVCMVGRYCANRSVILSLLSTLLFPISSFGVGDSGSCRMSSDIVHLLVERKNGMVSR